MRILGIESSCDETAAAVVEDGHRLLSNVVKSQIDIHKVYGGVVPEIAARSHIEVVNPVIDRALTDAKLSWSDIDGIAVTYAPGLLGSLLVGTLAARTIALQKNIPLYPIHHVEAHVYANFVTDQANGSTLTLPSKQPEFPMLALIVSGGHTQLVLFKDHGDYELLGQTQDDAVGEAFDKVARLLKLGYPGGPIISQRAQLAKENFPAIVLPRPMINSGDFNFSFSGLKTAVLYLVKKNEVLLKNPQFINVLCQEFENSVAEVLLTKTLNAAKKYHPRTVLLAGGVSANQKIRQTLGESFLSQFPQISFLAPDLPYTGDNASMIAAAALFQAESLESPNFSWKNISADSNLTLKNTPL